MNNKTHRIELTAKDQEKAQKIAYRFQELLPEKHLCNHDKSDECPAIVLVDMIAQAIADAREESQAEVEKLQKESKKWCSAFMDNEREKNKLENHIDLMVDEFKRIIACPAVDGGKDEINGLCERAIKNTYQHISVVMQRDNAEKKNQELQDHNQALIEALKVAKNLISCRDKDGNPIPGVVTDCKKHMEKHRESASIVFDSLDSPPTAKLIAKQEAMERVVELAKKLREVDGSKNIYNGSKNYDYGSQIDSAIEALEGMGGSE